MTTAALAGLGLGLSLIVAIGAQNAFVLRQGVAGRHVVPVVALCAASDAVLIAAGVGGAGALVAARPTVLAVVRVAGAAVLLGYAALAARRAARPGTLAPAGGTGAGLAATLGTAAALTWLNPHVYLDTVVLLGSVSATHGDQRWAFGAGAALGSLLWFTGLGFGARVARPLFARPGAWRTLDVLVATVMVVAAVTLLLGS
ncbi:LysE/ArgO family amino acid transporter [Rhodococcus aerolatus]